jgi:DNA invertase Pin-like site-specific DNA recombinase
MAIVGYGRVSGNSQDLSNQIAALNAADCDIVRSEKRSGASKEGREELQTILAFLRPGDSLVVTRIDRLALYWRPSGHRSGAASQKRSAQGDRAADLHIHGRRQSVLGHAGVFAEFESNLRRKRQTKGIARPSP